MAVKPGDILGDKYRVDALIGRGGMGHVFAATDVRDIRDLSAAPDAATSVAIKVVSRVLYDETLMARLHREAEAAARIRSDYVPRVLEVSDTDEKEMYLVMERLVGEPLSQRMRDKGTLPWTEVMQIGEDILRGLIDAHTAGVVHRDLKPSNVFLALRGGRVRAMVLDFGVCKLDTVDTERLTGTGESIGTVAYMAPEQIRGASKVDDRADLYAFGVLVFEMLCARLPHDGPSQMAILASKLENDPARLSDCARVDFPEGLDALVAKALVRDPNRRFTTAQELLKAWRKLGAPDVTSRPPPAVTSEDSESAHDANDAPTTRHVVEDDAITHAGGEISIPIESHPTQTALTAPGISLRKGGSGRVAFGLAAFALVAGIICVVAFFARGPDGPPATPASGAAAPSTSSEAAPAAAPVGASASAVESARVEAPAASGGEIDEGVAPAASDASAPSATSASSAARGEAKKSAPRAKPRLPVTAPKTSGPHITSQPRY